MPKRALRYSTSESASFPTTQVASPTLLITVSDFESYARDWIFDCEYRQHSHRTIETRRMIVKNLLWFLKHREFTTVGTSELKQFLHYLQHGHEDTEGRWGNPHLRRPVRPRTVKDYHGHLRTLFRWLQSEGTIHASPMERIAAPISRADQIQPFTSEQVNALLSAAQRSRHPRRDKAILLLLLDTGLRASELCGLKMRDVDLPSRNCRVRRKGNRYQTIYFGTNTAKSLSSYLKEKAKSSPTNVTTDVTDDDDCPLFPSDSGTTTGEALTRSGLLNLIKRLGRAAGVQGVRCSPHTFRHTFAVEFLRAGGNIFTLKELLSHNSLHMSVRYVNFAQADIEKQHRQFSPGDRIRKGTR